MATLVAGMKRANVACLAVMHLRDIEDDKWLTKGAIRGIKTQTQSARMVLMYQDYYPPKVGDELGLSEGDVVLECSKCSYGEKDRIGLRPALYKGAFEEVGIFGDEPYQKY